MISRNLNWAGIFFTQNSLYPMVISIQLDSNITTGAICRYAPLGWAKLSDPRTRVSMALYGQNLAANLNPS